MTEINKKEEKEKNNSYTVLLKTGCIAAAILIIVFALCLAVFTVGCTANIVKNNSYFENKEIR